MKTLRRNIHLASKILSDEKDMWIITKAEIQKKPTIKFLGVKILNYEKPLEERVLSQRIFWGTVNNFRKTFVNEKTITYNDDLGRDDYVNIPCDDINMKEEFSSQLYMIADHYLENVNKYKTYLKKVITPEEFYIPEEEFNIKLAGTAHAQYRYLPTESEDRTYTKIYQTLSKQGLL